MFIPVLENKVALRWVFLTFFFSICSLFIIIWPFCVQKMKQAKRMALYYDFCNKQHALMFCTDLAARGLVSEHAFLHMRY
jgi:hypothetical protein